MKKALFIGKQRLATEQDCSTVIYILEESIVEVWKTYGINDEWAWSAYGEQCVNNEE